jgi:hypothetical protein
MGSLQWGLEKGYPSEGKEMFWCNLVQFGAIWCNGFLGIKKWIWNRKDWLPLG